MKKIFTLLLLLCGYTLFAQTRYYVRPSGSDTSSGTSWETAFRTLQKAIQTISTGQVWVAAGTYYPDEGPGLTNNDRNLSFTMRNGLALYGGFAGTETSVDQRDRKKNITILSGDIQQNDAPNFVNNAENAYHVLHAYEVNNTAVLDGFSITGGNANGIGTDYNDGGGGMLNHSRTSPYWGQILPSAPAIVHCQFTGNSAANGGAIYNLNGAPAINACIFTGNMVTAGYVNPSGGALYYRSNESYGSNRNASIINSSFIGNTAYKSQGGGGAIYIQETYLKLTITNCTFVANSAASGVIVNNVEEYTKLTNCILWGNSGAISNVKYPAQVNFSIVQGGYVGTGILNTDPLFVNAASGNLHLMRCSPAIDAGNNAANTTATDLDGNPRTNDNIDMGAYEFGVGGDSTVFYVKADATGGGNGSSWADAFTSLQDALAQAGNCGITEFWVAKGTYYPDEGFGLTDNGRESSFTLKSGVALYGGFNGTETERIQRDWHTNATILNGDIDRVAGNSGNAYNVVRATGGVDSTTILDGFIITGGHADGYYSSGYNNGGGLYIYGASPQIANCSFIQNSGNYGGGVYNDSGSSPTLAHCSFTQNTATANGGGIFNDNASSPIIFSCLFSGNKAHLGGGIHNDHTSSPLVMNCIFNQNKATTDGGAFYNSNSSSPTIINCSFWRDSAIRGGGLYNYNNATPTIINSSFWGNSATSGGVLANMSTHATLANCIVWGNSSTFYELTSYSTVTYSIVQGGYAGTGNLNQDPMFLDTANGGLYISPFSPARDVGNDASVPSYVTTDVSGMPRKIGIHVDIGAYEVQAGDIIYVKSDASGLNNGSSWANAFTSLQNALALSSTRTEPTQIWVASGFYYPDEGMGLTDNDPNASFHLKKGVAIYGGFAGTENQFSQRNTTNNIAILSGDIDKDQTPSGNAYHVIRCDSVDHTAVLDGLTIGNGNANGPAEEDKQGGGIYISSSNPRIYRCVLVSNQAVYGGAVCNASSNPSFTWCRFIQNLASTGGALLNGSFSQFTLLSCSFTGNTAAKGGAIYNQPYSSLHITNALFSQNKATGEVSGIYKGGAIYNASAFGIMANCTFNANSASPGYGGAIYNEGSSPLITNTILWDNSSGMDNDTNSTPDVSYSLVQGGYAGGTNIIDQDPLFVNAPFGDLHLRGCSPAIDAGTTQGSYFADLDGKPRPMFNGVDIGAYEFQLGGPGGIVYVKADATGNNDGSSWTNAFTHLQDALALAGSCKALEIWVANGTYYPTDINTNRTASFVLQNYVTILGGFKGTESPEGPQPRRTDKSLLSGDIDRDSTLAGNSYHVVKGVGNDLSAVLDGFIITGGNADGAAGPDNTGGGIYLSNASPVITRCTISGNSAAYYGAGIYNDHSSPTIGRCIISGNKSIMYGGGIYNYYSSPTITNVLFWKDSATYGGGIYNYYGSSPRVTNCSFVYNGFSQFGGGMFNNNQTYPIITNCIFWGNSSQFYNATNSAPVVSYSIVQGGYPSGTMIINQDPLFVDAANGNFHIRIESPANDAGTHDGAPEIDLDGNTRGWISVDIGAYEYSVSSGNPLFTLSCPATFTLQSKADGCGTIAGFTGDHAATTSGGEAPVTITYAPASGELLPVGVNTIVVTATDGANNTKTCSFTITVVDTTSPVISNISVDKPVLYPPNHKMQEVQVNYTVGDNCPGVTTGLSITSNQPEYGTGSGDTGPDWQVINNHKLKLRSERSGSGSDRVYTIKIMATDAAGNTATASTTVNVPHDKGSVTSARAATTKEAGSLVVTAVPNPSSEGFTLYTQSPSTLPLSIRVMDGAGRIVESRKGVVANGTLYFGHTYRPGVYYVQVVQGDVLQTIKLVKQNR